MRPHRSHDDPAVATPLTCRPASSLIPTRFDDEKVSTVTRAKIQSLDGGGEDSAAYILLYRSVTPDYTCVTLPG